MRLWFFFGLILVALGAGLAAQPLVPSVWGLPVTNSFLGGVLAVVGFFLSAVEALAG